MPTHASLVPLNPETGREYVGEPRLAGSEPFTWLEQSADGWLDDDGHVWTKNDDGSWRHA